jgi:formylglycine-generating enzyme required for sulfatase activity
VKILKTLCNSHFFDINNKNISQVSVFQLAVYYKQQAIIDWLITNTKFDFNAKNSLGFTEVEQLKLRGYAELADTIKRKRPEVFTRKIEVKERNTEEKTSEYPDGTPIIDFVRIEPGSFMMGDGDEKVLTTISKPFEMMSVDITQKTYRVVVELLKQYFEEGEYNEMNATPSHFEGENNPVNVVTYDNINLWKKGLNELSELENTEVQKTLEKIFPGHKQGKLYSLPTEAQWEYVARLGGLAEGDYSFGNGNADLGDYTVYAQNSELEVLPVGIKKPVFYNGKPIYDIHGNVWNWIEDLYAHDLVGGIDPHGPNSGQSHVVRGGGYGNTESSLWSHYRSFWQHDSTYNALGFRLFRIIN